MKRVLRSTYFRWGTTIFLAGAVLVVFYQMVANFTGFKDGISSLISILSPFIYGFVMAYLIGPVYNYVVKKLYPAIKNDTKSNKMALRISKIIATIISMIVLIGVVVGMGALLIPQIVESVRGISQTLPSNVENLSDWANNILDNMHNTELANTIQEAIVEAQDNLLAWVQNTLLPGVGTMMQRVSSSVIVTIKTVLNIIIGVIACAYFLNGKESFKAQAKKLVLANFKEAKAEEIFEFAAYTNKTFGGFIVGKIIDSIIIGVLCFVAMSFIKLPYPILISTIVGVTNIIPFFGPFIGAIPSLAIIFLINPVQALWFLILVIILQQLDGNIIGPAILGNSIGIASFWVMFAIIIGGGLFGFMGMVLGVPVFAVIYYYGGKLIRKRLGKRGLQEETVNYIDYDCYEIESTDFTVNERPIVSNKKSLKDKVISKGISKGGEKG